MDNNGFVSYRAEEYLRLTGKKRLKKGISYDEMQEEISSTAPYIARLFKELEFPAIGVRKGYKKGFGAVINITLSTKSAGKLVSCLEKGKMNFTFR